MKNVYGPKILGAVGSSFEVLELVSDARVLDDEEMGRLKSSFGAAVRASEYDASKILNLPGGFVWSLNFGGSVIVDAGMGIEALTRGVPMKEQEFSAEDVIAALVAQGVVEPDKIFVRMGPAGGVTEDGRGAEVIEDTVIYAHDGVTRILDLTVAASNSEQGLRVDNFESPERVILENGLLVHEMEDNSNTVVVDIVVDEDMNLLESIFEAMQGISLEHFSVRACVDGQMDLDLSVIEDLPTEELDNLDELKNHLVPSSQSYNGQFIFNGTRTTSGPRNSADWEKISGEAVYGNKGHYHGFAVDRSVGGHIVGMTVKAGSRIVLMIEPAKVVQVS